MERWIHSFVARGTRQLTEDERRHCRTAYHGHRFIAVLWGLLAVLLGIGFFAGIAIAAGDQPLSWVLVAASLIFFFVVLSKAGDKDTAALRYRRAARIGYVTRFEAAETQVQVRDAYRRAKPQVDSDTGEPLQDSWSWEADERFHRDLERILGRPAKWFECVGEDSAILYIEDKLVPGKLTVSIQDIPGS